MEIHKILNRGEAFVSKLLLGTEMKVRRVMGFANPLHHSYGHMPTKPTKPIDIKVGKIRYPRARDHAVVRTSLIPFFNSNSQKYCTGPAHESACVCAEKYVLDLYCKSVGHFSR